MATVEDGTFEDRFVSQTTSYLDRLEACVTLLPELLERYGDGEPYQQTVERICDLESDCDARNRHISALIADADVEQLGIRLTRIHLHSGQIIELYGLLDEIANTAEQFAEELVAIDPRPAARPLEVLAEMAAKIVSTTTHLHRAVETYVHALCHPNEPTAIVDAVQQVRDAETDGDALRNEVLATAFDDAAIENPLVYREFALLLDSILDAMEDVTDKMIFISGNQSWIDVEPNDQPQGR